MDSIRRTKEHHLDVKLSAFVYKEGGFYICYSPGLDIAGHGGDSASAIESFKFIIQDFISDAMQQGTLTNSLKRLGWALEDGESSLEVTIPEVEPWSFIKIFRSISTPISVGSQLMQFSEQLEYA